MQLSVRDAAKLLNVSTETIYRWIKQGALPAYRINEEYRFNRAELLEWATSKRIAVAPEHFADAEPDLPLPTLADAVGAGGVVHHVAGADKASVLRAVVGSLPLPEDVDAELVYQVLLARESLGSTGIGDGIAIPHVRNPIVLHVTRPSVTVSFLEHPIDFAAVDGRPVEVLFTVISPTVRAHLHLLSRLGYVLRDEGLKAALKRQAPREVLLEALARAEARLPAGNGGAAAK